MSARRLSAALLIVCVISTGSAHALGLLQAYDLAVHNDPTFQAAIQERAAGEENRALGRSALLPTLTWNYTNSRNDSEVTQASTGTDRDYRSYASTLPCNNRCWTTKRMPACDKVRRRHCLPMSVFAVKANTCWCGY